MERKSNRLTVLDLRSMAIGDTLYDGELDVEHTAENRWQSTYRYTSPATGKRRAPAKTWDTPALKAMRAWRDPLRELVQRGIDPLIAREQEAAAQRAALEATKRESARQTATLLSVARAYHATIASGFRNRKHRAQWLASIEGSLPRSLLDKPIADITPADLLDELIPLRDRVPETAQRVRQRLDAVFADAALRGLCVGNPAALIVRRLRQKRIGEQPHLRALHYRDVPGFVAKLRASDRIGATVRLAIEFAIVTASRSGEVRGARWNEIDRKGRLWTVPAARMKRHEAHPVHLSPRALELLEEAATLRTDLSEGALVFSAPRDDTRPLSDMSLTQALRRFPTGREREDGKPETFGDFTTMHGLARTTFSTCANDQRIAAADVIEAALAHKETDRIRAAYNRSAKEGERFERELRALRMAWSDYVCNGKRGKVLPMRRGAAAAA